MAHMLDAPIGLLAPYLENLKVVIQAIRFHPSTKGNLFTIFSSPINFWDFGRFPKLLLFFFKEG